MFRNSVLLHLYDYLSDQSPEFKILGKSYYACEEEIGDIDVFTDNVSCLANAISKFCSKENLVISCQRRPVCISLVCIKIFILDHDQPLQPCIQIDLHSTMSWKSLPLFNYNDITAES